MMARSCLGVSELLQLLRERLIKFERNTFNGKVLGKNRRVEFLSKNPKNSSGFPLKIILGT